MSASFVFKKILTYKRIGLGVMLMCSYGFDVALCCMTVKNAALSFSQVGYLCDRE